MSAEQRVFAVLYFGGLLVLLGGVVLQLAWQIDTLLRALILWGSTRVILSVWQLLQPDVAVGPKPSRGRLIFTIAAWTLIVALLTTVEMTK